MLILLVKVRYLRPIALAVWKPRPQSGSMAKKSAILGVDGGMFLRALTRLNMTEED